MTARLTGRNVEMTGSQTRGVNGFRPSMVTLSLAVLLLGAGLAVGASATTLRRGPTVARAARVLNVHDEGNLRFVHASGSLLIDEGHVAGSFPGSVKVRFVYDGEPNVSAQFTIYGSGGSISAHGSARLSSPTSPAPSFRGRLSITGGSGRYAHVRGGGELFGVFNRRSYALTVQAIGKLPY
jgi:hypothetical protein